MANNGAHDTATTVIGDRATPDVSLNVAAVAVSGLSIGNAALKAISANLSAGSEITVSTDGTYDFGSVGPDLVILVDVSSGTFDLTVGDIATDNTGYGLPVATQAALTGGYGLITGATGAALANTDHGRLRISHGEQTRMFTSRARYFPPANRDRMIASLDGTSTDCQVKPIWHFTDEGSTGSDTDFFLVGNEKWQSTKFNNSLIFSTNMTGQTFSPGANDDSPASYIANLGGTTKAPIDSVYVHEVLWDQGTAFDGTTKDGYLWTSIYTQDGSPRIVVEETDEFLYSTAAGSVKSPTNFTYPGYIRGYRTQSDEEAYEAEVYIAAGVGAACRVAITDNTDFFSATQVTYLEVTAWASSEVKAKLRGGWFDLDDLTGKYICLVDKDNAQIGAGVEI